LKTKLKLYLTDSVYAVLSVDLSIPKDQKNLAESIGIGEEEQKNLIGQSMQTILLMLGNSDEA